MGSNTQVVLTLEHFDGVLRLFSMFWQRHYVVKEVTVVQREREIFVDAFIDTQQPELLLARLRRIPVVEVVSIATVTTRNQ